MTTMGRPLRQKAERHGAEQAGKRRSEVNWELGLALMTASVPKV